MPCSMVSWVHRWRRVARVRVWQGRGGVMSLRGEGGGTGAVSGDAVSAGGAVASEAGGARCGVTGFLGGGAKGYTSGEGLTFGDYEVGLPAVGGGVEVVAHSVARGLEELAVALGGGAAPLGGVARVTGDLVEGGAPDVLGDAEGVTGGADAEDAVGEDGVAGEGGVAAALVALPDAEGRLVPEDVAGFLDEVGAAAADGDVGAVAVADVGGDVLAEDPGLEHRAGLAVVGGVGDTGDDADDRGAVDG